MVCSALTLIAASLSAQGGGEGAIRGRVVAESGNPLAAATVEVIGEVGPSRGALTDEEGSFRASALPAGIYRVRVTHIGYRTSTLEGLRVVAGGTTQITITLGLTPVELEGVEVVSSSIEISQLDTDFGLELAEKQIEILPVSRNPMDLVAFTPGARPGHVWGGASVQANSYQLDGLAANHPGVGGDLIQPSINWIETIEVKGLGAGAEHGGFQGGLINVSTKSGTNELQGSVRTSVDSHHLNASNLMPAQIGSEVALYQDVEGEVRGPILRNRLFYYLAGQLIRRDTRFTNHLLNIEDSYSPTLMERRESKLFGKLTWKPTSKDVVEGSLGRIDTRVDHFGLSGYESAEATLRLDSPSTFYNLSWRRVWNAAVLEARVAGISLNETRTPYAGENFPGMKVFGIPGITPPTPAYNNASLRYRRAPASISAELNLTLDFELGSLDHQLEVGGEHTLGSFIDQRLRNGGMTWSPVRRLSLDTDDPTTWPFSASEFIPVIYGGEVDLNAEVENSALFAQANFMLGSRLTVNPGLRWGRWVGRLTPGGGETFAVVEDQAFDPRIGAIFDLTGDNSFVAKLHWGRYHQNMISQFFDRVQGGDVFSNEQLWFYRGPAFQDPATRFTDEERDRMAGDGLFTLEGEIRLNETGPVMDYRQPYVDQWIVGLEKTLGSSLKFEAVYVNRRNRQMVALVDRNRTTNYTKYEFVNVLDSSGQRLDFEGGFVQLRELYVPNDVILERLRFIARCGFDCDASLPPGFTLADTLNLTWDPDYVLTNAPGARREFEQFQFSAELSRPTWGASASLVFTDLVGNLDNVTGYENPAGFGAGPYVRVNEGSNSFGTLSNFSEREFKVALWGELPWQLGGGMFWTHAIGDHYSPRFTISGIGLYRYQIYNHGPEIDWRLLRTLEGHNVFVGPRGRPRHQDRLLVDIHLEREFPALGGSWTAALDIFNLFNTATVNEVNTSVNYGRNYYHFLPGGTIPGLDPNLYYQAPRERVPPRTLRLGLIFRF